MAKEHIAHRFKEHQGVLRPLALDQESEIRPDSLAGGELAFDHAQDVQRAEVARESILEAPLLNDPE
ncbi:MAG: hypothetical protein AB7J35_18365 [Dehalococcoidia bacterium]